MRRLRRHTGWWRVALSALALVGVAVGMAQPPGGDSDKAKKPERKRGRDFRDLTPEARARLEQLPPKERQAIEILRRMVTQGMKKPYIAREVTIKANGQETEQWVRWDPARGMRRESVRPAGNLFVDDLKQAYFFSPKDRKWFSRESIMPRPEGRVLDVLRKLYKGEVRAGMDGQDTVAGRTADIVRVGPAEGARGPVTRVWVDRATGIRLKTEVLGPDGRVFISTYLLSLDLNPKFRPDDFTPPADAVPLPGRPERNRTYRSLADARRDRVEPRLPSYLPTGFNLRVIEVRELPKGGRRTTTRFGNGVTALSLIQMPAGSVPPEMTAPLGSNQAGFLADPRGGPDRAYLWKDGDTVFLLLGNLPDGELKRVANSVK